MIDLRTSRGFSPERAAMNDERMGFDISQFREGGVVAGVALALWAAVAAGGASQAGQILTVIGTGLMGIITMLVKHLLEKTNRRDRAELRRLRDENEAQEEMLRLQATQINELSVRVARLRAQDTQE